MCDVRNTRKSPLIGKTGAPPSPTTAILEHLAKRAVVVLVPEPFTSAMCSTCEGALLQDAINWRVKHCATCRRSFHRDEIGWANIGAVFRGVITGNGIPAYLTAQGAARRGYRRAARR